ncbi:hypothetical protein [Trichoplusia ni single nucleopolyhedrovirus]|uniref:Uncharacterized protein n=1 Tax=Trichoplusia ni single nucleopolyhedrovirus TaxID=332054 RepID=Q461Z6_9ABAC|nr:hypothetical protein TNSV_gp069 [Trichoplusia ni single nucleopolyhedrovirus]AAZ67440.1 hypothetical protein [Trichoplusia ni single nucleopolyhedrovirus]
MKPFRDMHIDVVNSEGTKFSVRARVHDINSIEVFYHDIPITQRCKFVGLIVFYRCKQNPNTAEQAPLQHS